MPKKPSHSTSTLALKSSKMLDMRCKLCIVCSIYSLQMRHLDGLLNNKRSNLDRHFSANKLPGFPYSLLVILLLEVHSPTARILHIVVYGYLYPYTRFIPRWADPSLGTNMKYTFDNNGPDLLLYNTFQKYQQQSDALLLHHRNFLSMIKLTRDMIILYR